MTVIGLVASPGPAADLAQDLLPDLTDLISVRLPDGGWQIRLAEDRLVDAPADLSRLVAAARRRLLDEAWQMVICITDLPLATERRPVVAHASATHAVAVLSLPALGAVGVSRRAAMRSCASLGRCWARSTGTTRPSMIAPPGGVGLRSTAGCAS